MFGAAWAGENDVTKVEVTADGGKRWSEARLLEKPVRYAWRFWEYEWVAPSQPGRHTLMARATDNRSRVQPMLFPLRWMMRQDGRWVSEISLGYNAGGRRRCCNESTARPKPRCSRSSASWTAVGGDRHREPDHP